MEKIDQILDSLYSRVIEPDEAKEQLLLLFNVSGEVCDNCGEGKPTICAKCYEIESNFRESY